MRAPTVDRTHQPTKRHFGRQVANAFVSRGFARLVVHQEQHPGDDLNNEKKHGRPAEVIPNHRVRPFRHLLVTEEFDEGRDLVTSIKPAQPSLAVAGITHSASSPRQSKFLRLPDALRRTSEGAVAVVRTIPGRPSQIEHCGRHTR